MTITTIEDLQVPNSEKSGAYGFSVVTQETFVPELSPVYCFILDGKEILRFETSGDVYIRGEKVDSNRSIYETVVEFFKCVVAADAKANPSVLDNQSLLEATNQTLLECVERQSRFIETLKKKIILLQGHECDGTCTDVYAHESAIAEAKAEANAKIFASVLSDPRTLESAWCNRGLTVGGERFTVDTVKEREQLNEVTRAASQCGLILNFMDVCHCGIVWSQNPGYFLSNQNDVGWTRSACCGVCNGESNQFAKVIHELEHLNIRSVSNS